MGRRSNDWEPSKWGFFILLLMGFASCSMVYMFMSSVFKPSKIESLGKSEKSFEGNGENLNLNSKCCKGIENLELWGSAVKWGRDFKFNSSQQCCEACKAMCTGNDGPCLCDTWVFCGNKQACGDKFGECWLKKQKDTLAPEKQNTGDKIMWTSGLVFGRGEGIVGLETEYGTLHIKRDPFMFEEITKTTPELLPDCSPYSVAYILELLALRHCAGCQLYRAESRGQSWDMRGNHIKDTSFGPPFALIQGSLEAQGTTFNKIQMEHCPTIRRGSVAWVGSGPEFFISLANHEEWKNSYTVFGSVLPEDMPIAEKIARLPAKSDVWNNINVSVLEKPVTLRFKRIGHGDLNLSTE